MNIRILTCEMMNAIDIHSLCSKSHDNQQCETAEIYSTNHIDASI